MARLAGALIGIAPVLGSIHGNCKNLFLLYYHETTVRIVTSTVYMYIYIYSVNVESIWNPYGINGLHVEWMESRWNPLIFHME